MCSKTVCEKIIFTHTRTFSSVLSQLEVTNVIKMAESNTECNLKYNKHRELGLGCVQQGGLKLPP